jgi:uncharacterized protein (DUF2252 family)
MPDTKKLLPVTEEQRAEVTKWLGDFAKSRENPEFFKVLDVARRVAGTGSLGLIRYIVLVEGKGSPDSNYLLDLKEAAGSSLVPALEKKQPRWTTEAQRVVELQQRCQAMPMAFLNAIRADGRSYVLRGLQPTEDRVSLAKAHRGGAVEDVLKQMARLAAWMHLRAAGRQGSAIADELVEFGRKSKGRKRPVDVARECAERVRRDWETYARAYDDGAFRV